MRPLRPRVHAASALICRGFGTSSRSFGGGEHRLFFHRTAAAALPRRRTFFTSSAQLQQDGSHGRGGRAGEAEGGAGAGAGTGAGAGAAKHKARSSGAKSSLRRVAVMAQQPGGRAVGRALGSGRAGGHAIHAVCAAESFDMARVMAILRQRGFQLDPDGTGFESHEVVHARPGQGQGPGHGGDVFVFESGTLVTWGMAALAAEELATRTLLAAAADAFPERRETEELEFERDAGRDTSTVRGDVVVLGTRREAQAGDRRDTTLAQIAFSSGLARSTKLAALETSFTSYFESTRRIPALLARGPRPTGLSRAFILRKTGELLSLRAQLNHYRELTDSLPDIFWDSRADLGLEAYYDQVGRALDVGVRIKTLNQKMDYAQEIASVLREVSSETHNTRLELIIILLIAVEVVFELRRVFLERQPDGSRPGQQHQHQQHQHWHQHRH